MNWKQPIPTNLEARFGEDYRCIQLYKELIYRACNKKTFASLGDGKIVELSRGQALFGRRQYAKYLCWTPSTVERTLKKLQKTHQAVNLDVKARNYTVANIIGYDDIVAMNQPMNQQRTSDEPAMNLSKSVKSVKSENKKNLARVFLKHFNESLKEKKYFHRLTEEIIELYSSYVGDDPTLDRHNQLVQAVDNIKANWFYRTQAKVDIWNFFKKLDKWQSLEPQADPEDKTDNNLEFNYKKL